jgi:hypothetical protein
VGRSGQRGAAPRARRRADVAHMSRMWSMLCVSISHGLMTTGRCCVLCSVPRVTPCALFEVSRNNARVAPRKKKPATATGSKQQLERPWGAADGA